MGTETDSLYFIPLIAEALHQRDPAAALRDAFERIRVLGRQPRYRVGYRQFLRFMETALGSADAAPARATSGDASIPDPLAGVVILIERGDTLVATCRVSAGTSVSVKGLQPGEYCLRLDGGRVLWRGSLTQQHLLWGKAYPGQRLPAAAATERKKTPPTWKRKLMRGRLVLEVHAGVKAGLMRLTLQADPRET